MLRSIPFITGDLYTTLFERFGAGGGAYVVKATDEHGLPVVISRVLGPDRAGMLYIGKADSFVSRLIYLKRCLHPEYKTSGHPATRRFQHHAGLRAAFPVERLVVDVFGSPTPVETERAILVDYFRSYGEPPPLNRIG